MEKTIIAALNEYDNSFQTSLDNVILKDTKFNDIDKNNVKVGDYIYLYIKDGNDYFCDNTTYYCKVSSIDNNSISIVTPEWHFYSFNVDGVKIKDINGKKITSNDLKIGDTIKVININLENDDGTILMYERFSLSKISNVKKIDVIDNNDKETKENLANRNMIALKKAIIAGVNQDSLYVVDSENQNLLYQVAFAKKEILDLKLDKKLQYILMVKNLLPIKME